MIARGIYSCDVCVCVCVYRTDVARVWSELETRDPSLLEHFERFLSGVTAELKQSQHDKEKLQTHMKRYGTEYIELMLVLK